MAIVRSSKFRHVFGNAHKPDACFNGLKTEGSGDTNCAVSCKFFAMVKGSKIFVVPLDKPGRQEENNMFYIDCKNKVLDVAWSPFNDCLLASSEDSGDINVWLIPDDGLKETVSEPFWELHDVHTRKVSSVQWHPVAEYILAASGYDSFVTVWDCENQRVIMTIPCGEMPTNIAWNGDGSNLAITTKENKVMSLSIADARSGEVLAKNPECHQGPKPTKCIFMKNGNIITIGADRQANRSLVLWDRKDITEAICEVDIGNTSSVLNPYYDLDLGILYLFGKGESVVRYYEIDEDKEIFYLGAFSGSTSQKGGNFMPKRGVTTQNTEIARFYKLQPTKCEPVSFIVPRKSDHFQKDLYPPCACDDPGLTAEEWISGKNGRPVMKEFEETCGNSAAKREVKKISKPIAKKAPPTKSASGAMATPSAASNGVPDGVDLAELLDDMKKVKATVRKLVKRVAKLEEMLQQQDEGQEEEEEEEE